MEFSSIGLSNWWSRPTNSAGVVAQQTSMELPWGLNKHRWLQKWGTALHQISNLCHSGPKASLFLYVAVWTAFLLSEPRPGQTAVGFILACSHQITGICHTGLLLDENKTHNAEHVQSQTTGKPRMPLILMVRCVTIADFFEVLHVTVLLMQYAHDTRISFNISRKH